MKFKVIANSERVPNKGVDTGYLWEDNWNDWWEYKTLYVLTYFDTDGVEHKLGAVKIGQFNWREDQSRPAIPKEFNTLQKKFFSLGQDVSYYSAVAALDVETAKGLLGALRDIVADADLFTRAAEEPVTGRSLMRSVSRRSLEGQFRRVLSGGAVLTEFSFSYEGPTPSDPGVEKLLLQFNVTPDSAPPTNIHVIIGRNGVGKSFLLNRMARALVSSEPDEVTNGTFTSVDSLFDESAESPFANIVSVTFSAFDDFVIMPESRNALKGVRYSNVSLRQRIRDRDDNIVTITREPTQLAAEFSLSAKLCVIGEKERRWRRALTTLETDDIFADAQVTSLVDVDEGTFGRQASQLFRRLSSGHKIVLLTITKLVEKVEERTLVLMDEPEAHLHPPLLSAFVRALSDLLTNRNGVAVVATHSPVILQEVPASCVWKIVRHGVAARADRPEIETFGENVGVLTREVFGLEVTRSGFHRMITDTIAEIDNIEDVLAKFDNEVGSEGRALISNLLAVRDRRRQ